MGIAAEVFSWLPDKEAGQLGLTCRGCRRDRQVDPRAWHRAEHCPSPAWLTTYPATRLGLRHLDLGSPGPPLPGVLPGVLRTLLSLESLHLGCVSMNAVCLMEVVYALKDHSSLRSLSLPVQIVGSMGRNSVAVLCGGLPRGLRSLGVTLKSPGADGFFCGAMAHLKHLDLLLENPSQKGVLAVLQAVAEMPDLETLSLHLPRLQRDVEEGVLQHLRPAARLRSLTLIGLDSSKRPIPRSASLHCWWLAEAFRAQEWPRLDSLVLELVGEEADGDDAGWCMSEMLRAVPPLLTLHLCKCPYLGDDGIKQLAEALAAGHPRLQDLMLGSRLVDRQNRGGGDDGGLSCDGFDALGSALYQLRELRNLKLFLDVNRAVRSRGTTALTEGLEQLFQLEHLELGLDRLSSASLARDVSAALLQMPRLKTLMLSLDGNSILDAGLSRLANALSRRKDTLQELRLHVANNMIRGPGLTRLARSLKGAPRLTLLRLHWSDNDVSLSDKRPYQRLQALYRGLSLPKLQLGYASHGLIVR